MSIRGGGSARVFKRAGKQKLGSYLDLKWCCHNIPRNLGLKKPWSWLNIPYVEIYKQQIDVYILISYNIYIYIVHMYIHTVYEKTCMILHNVYSYEIYIEITKFDVDMLCPPRKISADDAAALTFGAGGRTAERIQRVSEAEVESLGCQTVGAGQWRCGGEGKKLSVNVMCGVLCVWCVWCVVCCVFSCVFSCCFFLL